MNEVLAQNVNELLSLLNDLLHKGVTAVNDTLPELFTQILDYGHMHTLFLIICFGVVAVISLAFFITSLFNLDGWDNEAWWAVFMVSIIAFGFSFAVLVVQVQIFLQIKYAPILYLIEQVSELL